MILVGVHKEYHLCRLDLKFPFSFKLVKTHGLGCVKMITTWYGGRSLGTPKSDYVTTWWQVTSWQVLYAIAQLACCCFMQKHSNFWACFALVLVILISWSNPGVCWLSRRRRAMTSCKNRVRGFSVVPLLAGLGLHLAGAQRSTATGSRGTHSSKP